MIVDVSNYRFGCGVYALALSTAMALRKNPVPADHVPDFVKTIQVGDVAPTADRATLQNLSKQLRGELAMALLQNAEFKTRRFESVLVFLLADDDVTPDPDMESMVKPNAEQLAAIKTEVNVLLAEGDFTQYPELLDNIDNAREQLTRLKLHEQWSDIYDRYVACLRHQAVFLSIDELGILAQHWQVGLSVSFMGLQGAENYYSYGDDDPVDVQVMLCNPHQNHWMVLEEGMGNGSIIDSRSKNKSSKKPRLSRSEKQTQSDQALVAQMLEHVRALTGNPDGEIQEHLIQLGNLAFDIAHNQDDASCIRNQFGVYSDEKGKTREERYNPNGIPFQGLFYIAKCLEKNSLNIDAETLPAWLASQHTEFSALERKLADLSPDNFDSTELSTIAQFAELSCDLLHLSFCIEALEEIPFNKLDCARVLDRYALARVYAILGETGKCLSSAVVKHSGLKDFFQTLGKVRDLVKLPMILPKTATRSVAAQQFLIDHGDLLRGFYIKLRDQILDQFNLVGLDTLSITYRTWLSTAVDAALTEFPLNAVRADLHAISTAYKGAKREDRQAIVIANESDSDDDDEGPKPPDYDQQLGKARGFIEACQSKNAKLAGVRERLRDAFGDDAEADAETIRERYSEQFKFWKKQQKPLRGITTGLEVNFKKYAALHPDLIGYFPDLPNPELEAVLACDTNTFPVEAITNHQPKKKKSAAEKLLVSTGWTKQIYEVLAELNPEGSIMESYAYDQCMAFLGQLFVDVLQHHREVLPEPTFSVWDQDFVGGIQLRHRRLMHNLPNYDREVVRVFVKNSVMPWRNNFNAFAALARHHHQAANSDPLPESDSITRAEALIIANQQNLLGMQATDLHQWKKAEAYLQTAYHYAQGFTDDLAACILHNLADVYRANGPPEQVLSTMFLAWEHRRKFSDPMDEYYLSTLINLGMCYAKLNLVESAEACFDDAERIALQFGLDQEHLTQTRATFYADQMNYPRALTLYKQAIDDCRNPRSLLFLYDTLAQTYVESGFHEQAYKAFMTMKMIFERYRPQFKTILSLGSQFLRFDTQCRVGPVYILDLMGRNEEALALLERKGVPDHYNILKLRLLRNLNRYEEAEVLGTSLVAAIESGLFTATAHAFFTCRVVYADVLLALGQDEEGVALLQTLCGEAKQLTLEKAHSQVAMGAFNRLCGYHIDNENYSEALRCIQSGFYLLKELSFVGLSEEVFIFLVRSYQSYLLSGHENELDAVIAPYVPLIAQFLKRPHIEDNAMGIVVFIGLLLEHQRIDDACCFYKAVMSDSSYTHPETKPIFVMQGMDILNRMIMMDHSDFSMEACERLVLSHAYNGHDRNRRSFLLGNLLLKSGRYDVLCELLDRYLPYWNEHLGFPLLKVLLTAYQCAFMCMDFKADSGDSPAAAKYVRECIRLLPVLFAELAKTPERLTEYRELLFQQYRRLPMALAEFQTANYGRGFPYFLTLLRTDGDLNLPKDDYDVLNELFFSGELEFVAVPNNSEHVIARIPASWGSLLQNFLEYLVRGLKQPRPPLLQMLNIPIDDDDFDPDVVFAPPEERRIRYWDLRDRLPGSQFLVFNGVPPADSDDGEPADDLAIGREKAFL